MTPINAIASVLEQRRSGHWGIVELVGSSSGDEPKLRPILVAEGVAVLRFRALATGVLVDAGAGRSGDVEAFNVRLTLFLAEAKKTGSEIVRCVVTCFEQLSIEEQCLVLRYTRAARETASEIQLQTIILGRWNYFRVQEHWKEHLQSVSPAIDSKHVYYEEGVSVESVIEMLQEAHCVSQSPHPFDYTCARAIVEVSGGDLFVSDYIVSVISLKAEKFNEFEAIVLHLHEEGGVRDEIQKRLRRLAPNALELLGHLLRRLVISRPERDSAAEELRLAGFIKTRSAGTVRYLSVSSVLMDRLVRASWISGGTLEGVVYDGLDMAQPIQAINTEAYQIVAQIENLLRNLLVVSLSESGEWTRQMDGVKTLAEDEVDASGELISLAREINARLRPPTESVEVPGSEPPVVQTPVESDKAPKPKSAAIVEVARRWRNKQSDNTMLTLWHDSLIYFFTTEGLVSVLVNKKQGIYERAIKRYFPDRNELMTLLKNFVAIRAAVAHNQPVTLLSVRRLEKLRDDFEKRICQVSDGTRSSKPWGKQSGDLK